MLVLYSSCSADPPHKCFIYINVNILSLFSKFSDLKWFDIFSCNGKATKRKQSEREN